MTYACVKFEIRVHFSCQRVVTVSGCYNPLLTDILPTHGDRQDEAWRIKKDKKYTHTYVCIEGSRAGIFGYERGWGIRRKKQNEFGQSNDFAYTYKVWSIIAPRYKDLYPFTIILIHIFGTEKYLIPSYLLTKIKSNYTLTLKFLGQYICIYNKCFCIYNINSYEINWSI